MTDIFKKNRNVILLTIIVITLFSIAYPFLHVIAAAVVTAYFAYPLFRKLRKHLRESLSMILTWIVILATIIVPLWIISSVAYYQVKQVVRNTAIALNNPDTYTRLESTVKNIPYIGEYISLNEVATEDTPESMNGGYVSEVGKSVGDGMKWISENALKVAGGFAKELPLRIIKIILYIFLTSSLLIHGIKIRSIIKQLLPIDGSAFERYVEKMQYMTDGIVKGNFIIAAIQATVTALSFWAVGIPYTGLIWIVSFILYIPMIGTSILYVPATLYLVMSGKWVIAIFFFIWNSVLVANIDNVSRGKFVPKEAQINNSLIFLSVLSGVILFGPMGVLYGPLLTVIGITSIQMYLEVKGK